MTGIQREDAYLVSLPENSFRAGIPALIIGVNVVRVISGRTTGEFRPCYRLRYSDGTEDDHLISIPHKIITFDDIVKGNIPEKI